MDRVLTHFTYEGKHYYHLGLFGCGQTVYADASPVKLPASYTDPRYASERDYVAFDHPVQEWAVRRVRRDTTHYQRNGLLSPFAVALPDRLDDRAAILGLAKEHNIPVTQDEDGEYTSLEHYYDAVWEEEESFIPIEFTEVRELGEFKPCPWVNFEWRALAPKRYALPPEMHHLIPCTAPLSQYFDSFAKELEARKEELSIKNLYHFREEKREISVYWQGGGVNVWYIKGDVEGENIWDLQPKLEAARRALWSKIIAHAHTAECPRCGGSGKVEAICIEALAYMEQAVKLAWGLQTSRNKKQVEAVIDAIRSLRRYVS